MPAPYTASQIAKWLLSAIDRDSGDSITPLKLQKLIYYAQAWSLALPERAYPLFDEDMQAWAHGPVVESVSLSISTRGGMPYRPPMKF